jgi:hypothetical protein
MLRLYTILSVLCWTCLVATSHGFVLPSTIVGRNNNYHNNNNCGRRFDTSCDALSVPGMWGSGLNFGKGDFAFYRSFEAFMRPFTQEDREAYPEVFTIPKGVYEVSLTRPLGIIFEEIDIGKGVYVQDLIEDGLAARQGKIQVGDILLGVTAVKIVGAKWERRMIPARKFDFDTTVGAIGSNEAKWGCDDVVLMFERPGEANQDEVNEFFAFLEPPFDNRK